jgi:hypothetical protein
MDLRAVGVEAGSMIELTQCRVRQRLEDNTIEISGYIIVMFLSQAQQ